MWVAVYLWLSFQCFTLSCLFLGLYLLSILCPVIYLLIFFSVLVSFCLFLIPFSEVGSVTFSVSLFSPQSSSSPPQTSACMTGERTAAFPCGPPLPFPHLFSPIFLPPLLLFTCADSHLPFHINRRFLYLQFILSTSSRFSPLFPFGSHLSLKPCFFHVSLFTSLLTSVKFPLLPFHLSSVPFLAVSLPLQFMTAVSPLSLWSLLYISFFTAILYMSLVPSLTSNVNPLNPQLFSLVSFFSSSFSNPHNRFRDLLNLCVSVEFSIYLSLSIHLLLIVTSQP